MDKEEGIITFVDCLQKSKDLLNEGQKIQAETSIHLRLSIEKLLKYGDKYHLKIPDREFLENTIKENSLLLSHYDSLTEQMNSFTDKVFGSF